MAFYCNQCNNFDKNDRNRNGEGWCSGWNSYVDPYKIANHCRKFWFLVNKTYEILNIDGNESIINSSKLRDNFIMKEVDCAHFACDYVHYAPILCEKMESDIDGGKYIADFYMNHCINPVIDYINDNNYEQAFNIFENAFYSLADYYDVNIEENCIEKGFERRFENL